MLITDMLIIDMLITAHKSPTCTKNPPIIIKKTELICDFFNESLGF